MKAKNDDEQLQIQIDSLAYDAPLHPNTEKSKNELKSRIRFVKNDLWGQFAVAGEPINKGFWSRFSAGFLSFLGTHLTIAINGQDYLLNKNSALQRLGIDPKELKECLKKDNRNSDADAHQEVTKLIIDKAKAKNAELETDAQNRKFKWYPNLALNQHRLLGAHNAGLNGEERWFYKQQKWSLSRQLDAGVRAIELDIGANNKGKLMITHGTVPMIHTPKFLQRIGIPDVKLPLRSWQNGFRRLKSCEEKLLEIQEWLLKEENRNEILVIRLDNARDKSSPANAIDAVIDQKNLAQLKAMLFTPEDRQNNHDDLPTIGEMQKGKRVMIINFKATKIGEKNSIYTHYRHDVLQELHTKKGKLQMRGLGKKKKAHKEKEHAVDKEEPQIDPKKITMVANVSQISNQTVVNCLKPIKTIIRFFKPKFKCDDVPKSDREALEGLATQTKNVHEDLHPIIMTDFVEDAVLSNDVEAINKENEATSLRV